MIVEGLAPQSIVAAVRRLRDGDLVGLPTETVYGLAANADDAAAVAKIFQAKGRPADHPLIVHVLGAAQVAHFARQVPEFAQALMRAFWPGPLTLILARRSDESLVPLTLPGERTAPAVVATVNEGYGGLRVP